MASFRTERLAQMIQQKISSYILEGRIKDSRVNSFASITKVDVSKDLSYADVYVSDIRGINSTNDSTHLKKTADGLQSAAGFIQSQLNAEMHIRKIPHLRFHADTSISESFDLIKKIDELVQKDSNAEDMEI